MCCTYLSLFLCHADDNVGWTFGDSPNLPLVDYGHLPQNDKKRLRVLDTMAAHTQFCMYVTVRRFNANLETDIIV